MKELQFKEGKWLAQMPEMRFELNFLYTGVQFLLLYLPPHNIINVIIFKLF